MILHPQIPTPPPLRLLTITSQSTHICVRAHGEETNGSCSCPGLCVSLGAEARGAGPCWAIEGRLAAAPVLPLCQVVMEIPVCSPGLFMEPFLPKCSPWCLLRIPFQA